MVSKGLNQGQHFIYSPLTKCSFRKVLLRLHLFNCGFRQITAEKVHLKVL